MFPSARALRHGLYSTISKHQRCLMQMSHVTNRGRQVLIAALHVLDERDDSNMLAAILMLFQMLRIDAEGVFVPPQDFENTRCVSQFQPGTGGSAQVNPYTLSSYRADLVRSQLSHSVGCPFHTRDGGLECENVDCIVDWMCRPIVPLESGSETELKFHDFPFSFLFCGRAKRASEKGPYLISLTDDGVGGLETFRSHMDVILKRAQVIWSSFTERAGALQETSKPVESGKNSDTKSPTIVAGPYLKMLSLSGRSIIQCPEDTPALFLSKDVRFRQCGENMRMYIIVD